MAEQLIVSDPKVMMGKPVVSGTRMTVELILEELAAGETIEQILDAHPRLTREGVQAALVHAHRAEAVVAGQGTFTSVPPMCLPAPPSPVWTDPRRSGSTT